MVNHHPTRIVLVLLFALIFSGCEAKRDVKIGEKGPVFSAVDITGEPVNMSQFKGKVVVIYFWTNSCCGSSLQLIEPYYRANRHKDLALLAINVADTKEIVKSYAKDNELTFTVLADEHSNIFKQYQAFGFPTIFIIDGNGIIRKKILGNIPVDNLEKLIQRQLDIHAQAGESYEKNIKAFPR